MANEVSVTVSLGVNKPGVTQGTIGDSLNGLSFTMTGSNFISGTFLAPITTAGAIPLGQVTAPHWCLIVNQDPVNSVTIRNGVSGADVIQLLPGECALFPFLSTSVPYILANTAPVLLSYWIFAL